MKKTAVFLTLIILIFGMASCTQKDEFKKGTLTSTTYESEYLNLKFTVPEGYTLATEEEMNKLSKSSAQVLQLDSQAVDATMENTSYEMQAVYAAGNPNVILLAEKLALSNMTIDSYIEALKKQLSGSSTIKFEISTGKEKASIAGQEYTKLSATATYGATSLTQDYYIRIQGSRAISFIFTYTSDTVKEKDALIAAFKEYK